MLNILFFSENIDYAAVSEDLLQDYLVLVNDYQRVGRFIGREDKRTSPEKELQWVRKKQEEKAALYSMIERKSGDFIGNIELMDLTDTEAELGIAITAAKQDLGYGTEAIRRILEYGFRELGLERIFLKAYPGNARAIHVYEKCGFRYVSTHPMFGPTFANLGALSSENAIVINEGDYMGRIFFLDLYRRLGLNVHEYSFDEHDEAMAYSLSVPFVSTFVFSAVMKHQDAPGTTFKRHLTIAKGVLSEDDTLLREILFNPRTKAHVEGIRSELKELIQIIDNRDEEALNAYLTKIRGNIR